MVDDVKEKIRAQSWLDRLTMALLREPQDRDQLLAMLRDAERRELIDSEALAMLEGVLQVSTMRVRDIMVPRSKMVVIEKDATLDEILPIVIESGHSRFPVIGENRDEVVGILLAKDLLPYSFKIDKPLDLCTIVRPATYTPESKRLAVLLREFRLTHKHMALIVDEYGGISGLVTIEDVLEEIVGEIEDEYDIDEEPNIKQNVEGAYLVKALTPIEEFNEYFNANISSEEFDTIGGLIMSKFGYLPKRDDKIDLDRYEFKILNASKRRIRLLQVKAK
jgi:magnesium and cobalt transporter